jgi:hypothetical protein
MKKQLQMLLDFPGMVNQKVLNGFVNNELDKFDSQNGIRCYVKTIYQWLALIVLISMEFGIIKAALAYFSESTDGGLAKAGSILAILVLLYAAFPIAKLIRTRGESLGESHNGMVTFVFSDFIKTNIRMMGEVAAILGLAGAANLTLSFLLDNNLFSTASGAGLLDLLSPIYSLPMEALNAIFKATGLSFLGDLMTNAASFRLPATSSFGGDFRWVASDLVGVLGAYINVMIGLAFMYINLAIYGYLFNIVASIVKWVSSPTLPISIRNKNV